MSIQIVIYFIFCNAKQSVWSYKKPLNRDFFFKLKPRSYYKFKRQRSKSECLVTNFSVFLSPYFFLWKLDSLVVSNLHFLPNFLSGRNLRLNKDEQPSGNRLTLAPFQIQNLCTICSCSQCWKVRLIFDFYFCLLLHCFCFM